MTLQAAATSIETPPAPRNSSGAGGPGSPGAPGGGQRPGPGGVLPSSGPGRRRVLIVDDVEPTRRLLAITLRRSYDVLIAADGIDGLDLAFSDPPPDLIVTDVMMPRLDGVSMVRDIKRRD